MRIISGTKKGRRIHPPKSLPVRPTTDFAKEGLFNVLRNECSIEDCDVLDLFAGTGNMSFEFASRGAKQVTAVDENYACIRFIKQTKSQLELNAIQTLRADVLQFIDRSKESYDLIFADPPYQMNGLEKIPGLIFEKQLLKNNGILIFEHSQSFEFSDQQGFQYQKTYGNVNFTFFQ